ncbi:methyltransferase domain-containing protein [Kiritimatiellaeota bacterium B1221]|nr:methyltransferase domain-containing protein [Kiritimatiellaeota bacterium B1221]
MKPDLNQRSRVSELMDAPDSDERKLFRTLDQFRSINQLFSRVRGPLKKILFPLLSAEYGTHLLDLGAGGCDIPVWLLQEAENAGLQLRITAVDSDPRVVRYARQQYGEVPGLRILEADALHLEALAPFDFIFGNHFLHHLTDPQIRDLLQQAERLAAKGYLFSDLQRSRFSYQAFRWVSLLYRDSFAREDGLISISKGFTPEELKAFAPSPACQLQRKFPGRVLLSSLKP